MGDGEQRAALGHDVAPAQDFGRCVRPEKAEIGLRDDGRGCDLGGLDYERRDRGRQDVVDEDFPLG